MKKTLSVILSAALGVSVLYTPAYAADDTSDIVLFGDSIAAGYGLDDSEYSYGEICSDYLGWRLQNHANSGDTTNDLYTLLTEDPVAAGDAAEAEVIVVSIGGNDIILEIMKYALNYAAGKGLLADGKTAADIPESPTINDAQELLDQDKLMSYLSNNLTEASVFASGLKQSLIGKAGATGSVQEQILPSVSEIIQKLSELNPDADIIVQNVYQPLQFSQEYWNSKFGTGAEYEKYASAVKLFRNIATLTMDTFDAGLDELTVTYNFKVADVYGDFTSVESPDNTNQGYAYYFTNIQYSGDERDIHPNQKGHLAIAAVVLEQIGILKNADSASLLRNVYDKITSDGTAYPEIAYQTYKLVAGEAVSAIKLGDVNRDNIIDAVDASFVLSEYAKNATGQDSIFDNDQKLAADANKDSLIDAVDASFILAYYAYMATGGTGSFEEYMANKL